MDIDHVHIQPRGSSTIITLAFKSPSEDLPYILKGASGLDVPELSLPTYGKMTVAALNMVANITTPPVMPTREIVLYLGLNPDYSSGVTFSQLRDSVYRIISANRIGILDLRLANESGVVAEISGSIVKVEASHSTKTPEVQVTVRCSDPMFRGPRVVLDDFSNPTGMADVPDYESTAPHGLLIEAHNSGPTIEGFIIADASLQWGFGVSDVSIPSQHRILISSENDDKYVYHIPESTSLPITHLGGNLIQGSTWPLLYPGENRFLTLTDTFNSLTIDKISYRPAFWGV